MRAPFEARATVSNRPGCCFALIPASTGTILTGGHAEKAQAIRASGSCSPNGEDWLAPRMDPAGFATALTERRAALGNPELPRNPGNNRTDSKRTLLAAIEAAGGRW